MKNIIITILNYIDGNLYKKITIEELSQLVYFNKDYIMRIFKKEIKMTIVEYINKRKVFNSLHYLRTTNDSILKISLIHGYSSQEYYSEIFSKYIGVSPLVYRKFSKSNIDVKYSDIVIIRKNLTKIKYELDSIDKYKVKDSKNNRMILTKF